MAQTSFYWDGKSGAIEYDGKSAVLDSKPVVPGVDFDTLLMSDAQGVHQKTLALSVSPLSVEEQNSLRTYASKAVVEIPVDDSVLHLDRYQSVSEHAQGVGRKNLCLDTIIAGLASLESGNPSGTIIAYAGKTIPKGYLLCNGGAVSRTTYAKLFEAIGTTYGAGDGTTTFNLPNLHKRFAEFTTTTSEVGQKVEAGLPDITGEVQFLRHGAGIGSFHGATGCFVWGTKGEKMAVGAVVAQTHETDGLGLSAKNNNIIYGRSEFVQPPSIKLLPVIRF